MPHYILRHATKRYAMVVQMTHVVTVELFRFVSFRSVLLPQFAHKTDKITLAHSALNNSMTWALSIQTRYNCYYLLIGRWFACTALHGHSQTNAKNIDFSIKFHFSLVATDWEQSHRSYVFNEWIRRRKKNLLIIRQQWECSIQSNLIRMIPSFAHSCCR